MENCKLKQHLNIAEDFQYSVNIEYDINNESKVKGFIPTTSTFETIEDIMLSTHTSSNDRARILIGAYGKGKSHLVLVILSLLLGKNISAFSNLLPKIKGYNADLYEYIKGYIESDKKLLPVIIQGGNSSLSQAFLSAMQRTLNLEDLTDLMPDTHFTAAIEVIENWKENFNDTYKKFEKTINEPAKSFVDRLSNYDTAAYTEFESIYPTLTSGSSFNPFVGLNIVDLYEDVTKKLKSKGYVGIYVIYDEFSKYLEADITKINSVDIRLLQDFAEKCNRSGENQMHIMLISHKDISNYIDKLPKQKVDGWRGVSERFKHIEIKNNFSQIYEIIETVIGQNKKYFDKFFMENKVKFEDSLAVYKNQPVFNELEEDRLNTVIYGCYPMHPISTFILPRLSEKVAQNERTLFTFLSSQNKNTLYDFVNNVNSPFPVLTPDYIYDYFEQVFKKEVYTSDIYKMWKSTNNILRRISGDELGSKIIKTIALIYITDQFEKLAPTPETIINIFRDSVADSAMMTNKITDLQKKQYVIYKYKSNNYLKLKDNFAANIEDMIDAVIEKNKENFIVKDIINEFNNSDYLYPTAYNDDNEITRYFNFSFITDNEFLVVENWDKKIEDIDAMGIVYGIMLSDEENRKEIINLIEKNMHNRIVFILPSQKVNVINDCLEYKAVSLLKKENADDEIISEELDLRIEDNENILASFVSMYLMPEMRCSEYYFKGEKKSIFRKTQISELLSSICEELYTLTPIIKNEIINKDTLNRGVINNRNKVVTALLSTELKPNLGLTGFGPDVSIMRSVLINTGILIDVETTPKLLINDDRNNKYQNVLTEINNFFKNSNSTSLAELYDVLTKPEHHIGLKKGVIPVFLSVVLNGLKQYVVIYKNGNEIEIGAELLTAINESPADYTVYLENWDKEKEEYIVRLEKIFVDNIRQDEKEYNTFGYIVKAMQRWFISLPKYAKEMKTVYKGARIDREKLKFINSIKKAELNAREFLFDDIIEIYNLREFSPNVADSIAKTKETFDEAITVLIRGLITDVREMFTDKHSKEATLSSIMLDWYDVLKDDTKNYLFNNGEDKILNIIKNTTADEKTFVQRLAKSIVDLRIEDWNESNITTFMTGLKTFKETIENQDNTKTKKSDIVNEYQLTFVDNTGNAVTKTFEKSEYSNRAKLLLNEVTEAIESMGQSITENEKRQVLMEILEKLCK